MQQSSMMVAPQQNNLPCGGFPPQYQEFMTPLPPIPTMPGYTPFVMTGTSPLLQPMPGNPMPVPNFQLPPKPMAMPPNMMQSASPMFMVTGPGLMRDFHSDPTFGPIPNIEVSNPNFLNQAWMGSRSPSPYNRSRSHSSCSSDGHSHQCGPIPTRERPQSIHAEGEVSKKELVDRAIQELVKDFGGRFDTDGLRGMNILRIKVKTRVALEHIVDFIRVCEKENLIELVSCPISTKKGRQHVRGFLAYLQSRNEKDADRICALFHQYNETHNNPFKAYQRNPKSTLYKKLLPQ